MKIFKYFVGLGPKKPILGYLPQMGYFPIKRQRKMIPGLLRAFWIWNNSTNPLKWENWTFSNIVGPGTKKRPFCAIFPKTGYFHIKRHWKMIPGSLGAFWIWNNSKNPLKLENWKISNIVRFYDQKKNISGYLPLNGLFPHKTLTKNDAGVFEGVLNLK